MRTYLAGLTALLFAFLGAGLARAGDRENALALIERAIQAHGGADALKRSQTYVRTGSGSMYLPDKTTPFKDEWAVQLPDKVRANIELGAAQERIAVTIVINGDKGWQNTGGATSDLPKERIDELKEEAFVSWLTTLVPLKKENVDLGVVPDANVNGLPANGIKASVRGHGDVQFYFDKRSGLLTKVERKARDLGLTITKESLLGDHREFQGAKLPTKLTELINGKKFTEVTVSSYKLPGKIEDSFFARP